MTDHELQLALARLLPNELEALTALEKTQVYWKAPPVKETHYDDIHLPVADTEWLYVCWLVEQVLHGREIIEYINLLLKETGCSGFVSYKSDTEGHARGWDEIAGAACWFFAHASWQQRAQALCKVKQL